MESFISGLHQQQDMNFKIGIFGGTFDPPHIGHLVLASEAVYSLDLRCVLWVLTPQPPHKVNRQITQTIFREKMLRSAISKNDLFEFSEIELRRKPPHYAVETVQIIKEQHPGASLYYLMGSDSLNDISSWYKPHEFISLCDAIGVMKRPNYRNRLSKVEGQFPEIKNKVKFIQAPLLEISSSNIRDRIASGRHFRYFLPSEVYKIILENELYTKLGD